MSYQYLWAPPPPPAQGGPFTFVWAYLANLHILYRDHCLNHKGGNSTLVKLSSSEVLLASERDLEIRDDICITSCIDFVEGTNKTVWMFCENEAQ